MSSEKVFTTVGISRENNKRIRELAKKDQRSVGFIVDKILTEYFTIKANLDVEVKRAD